MSSTLSRRDFLNAASLASAAVAFPQIMRGQGGKSPNDRINVALIGNGLICSSHFGALTGRDDVCRIVAVCDVNLAKARSAAVEDGTTMLRLGKKAAGRVLDGMTWDGLPRIAMA